MLGAPKTSRFLDARWAGESVLYGGGVAVRYAVPHIPRDLESRSLT